VTAFFLDYAAFFLKAATIVIAIGLVIVAFFNARKMAAHMNDEGELQITDLKELFHDLTTAVEHSVLGADEFKKKQKAFEKEQKQLDKEGSDLLNVFVLDFEGDIKASAAENLRYEINALLGVLSDKDEVVVRLESSGGMVHSYGFAASQLARIRAQGAALTICVDKVAASGGYMMACIGTKILAAPFAILGSIGVVAQLPNFNRLLKKHDVDVELHTAGQYKRTLTIFGENTQDGRQKFQQELEIIHSQFKAFVADFRPQLNLEEVATGETWLGMQAKENHLIDEITTSDAYLLERSKNAQVFKINYRKKKTLGEKLGLASSDALAQGLTKIFTKLQGKELI